LVLPTTKVSQKQTQNPSTLTVNNKIGNVRKVLDRLILRGCHCQLYTIPCEKFAFLLGRNLHPFSECRLSDKCNVYWKHHQLALQRGKKEIQETRNS
jgi:hypothetical protein